MSGSAQSPRTIDLCVRTIGGHEFRLQLPEDADALRQLFTAFANHPHGGLVQLPLDEGRTACTIAAGHIVSIVTTPPVLVDLQPAAPADRSPDPTLEPPKLHRAEYVVIDDFLGVDENRDMLAFALRDRNRFEPGTVEGKRHQARRNSVILDFGRTAHANLIVNRLLIWFPLIARSLGEPMFPLQQVEAQLTASNDGDFYGSHLDTNADGIEGRAIACVYYFFDEPKGFLGGALRLYDTIEHDGRISQAESFQEIEPANNRLVAFRSRTYHELRPTRCPSKEFSDSRFAVTTWLHRSAQPDPNATFGWGQFHCGEVPPALA
jgi:Rps23 Pro-64 3,4-dihydroxylase Tpa1-like proline 4-hydroxylase